MQANAACMHIFNAAFPACMRLGQSSLACTAPHLIIATDAMACACALMPSCDGGGAAAADGKVIKVIKVIHHYNHYYNRTSLIEMSPIAIMKLQKFIYRYQSYCNFATYRTKREKSR